MQRLYSKIEASSQLENSTVYRKMIGQLLYVSGRFVLADISAVVSILSQKLSSPTTADLTEVKRIFKYLKGPSILKLQVSGVKCDSSLKGFVDANWGESRADRKSNTGYIFKLNGGTISWASRKQKTIALSSTEAEYIALAEASQELIWLRRLCCDFNCKQNDATTINVDNQSCMKLVENEKFSNRSKHIDIKYHFVRDLYQEGVVSLKYCSTESNTADILTKPLSAARINKLREQANLI
jgi:hypothetical protein